MYFLLAQRSKAVCKVETVKPVYIMSDEKLRQDRGRWAEKYKTEGKPLNLITTVVLKYLRFYVSEHIDLPLFFCVKAIQS